MNSKNILVLGAGVSGLTTALALLRAGHKVTVWSKESLRTFPYTSLNAYAIWVPVRIDADPRVERWTDEGRAAFTEISQERNSGVALKSIVSLKTTRDEPWFAGKDCGFRHAQPDEFSAEYADAHILEKAPVIDPIVYLPWLQEQVIAAGGIFLQREIASFAECPKAFAVIINCTGLGSRKLAADDGLFGERVQTVKIKANGFDQVVIDDEGPNKRACIVPHGDYIKLGAVFDGASDSVAVNNAFTRDILDRCNRMVPGFNAQLSDVIGVHCALRPERALTRVELIELDDGRALVHNYGHDGMGYILSHGIAAEIVGYVKSL